MHRYNRQHPLLVKILYSLICPMPKKPIRILLMFTEEIMRCAETMKRL